MDHAQRSAPGAEAQTGESYASSSSAPEQSTHPVGAAQMTAALLHAYDLPDEARSMAVRSVEIADGGSGLQFRTPAAWTTDRRDRAPLNMQPLAIWNLLLAAEH